MLSSTTFLPHQGLMRLWILTVCVFTIFSGSFVTPTLGAPAKLDALAPPPQSPFPLEAQPTQFTEAIAAALKSDIVVSTDGIKSLSSAVDSYGNPIETLKPIDTPDGRKVISAQGLQFEIPNYASGITEIKKPADDLLPPFIAPFEPTTASGSADSVSSSDQDFGSSTKTTFTKSNEGKVITNNISGNNGVVTTATKQFGFSTTSTTSAQASLQKDFQQSTFSGSSATFNKAVTPSGFTSTQQTNFNSAGSGKYTGGFGGAPGVLGSGKFGSAVNTDGTIRTASNVAFGQASTTAPKLTTGANFASRIGIVATGAAATGLGVGVNKYQGTFGGPPGVLTPFDNVKSG